MTQRPTAIIEQSQYTYDLYVFQPGAGAQNAESKSAPASQGYKRLINHLDCLLTGVIIKRLEINTFAVGINLQSLISRYLNKLDYDSGCTDNPRRTCG